MAIDNFAAPAIVTELSEEARLKMEITLEFTRIVRSPNLRATP